MSLLAVRTEKILESPTLRVIFNRNLDLVWLITLLKKTGGKTGKLRNTIYLMQYFSPKSKNPSNFKHRKLDLVYDLEGQK